MKILLILKDNLNRRVPILSVAQSLVELGHTLTIVSLSINNETRLLFEKKGAKVITIGQNKIPGGKFLNRLYQWGYFRKEVKKIISQHADYIVWLASADAAIAVGRTVFSRKYILQIQELYDQSKFYRKHLKDFMQKAQLVFVPEETRAHIFRTWYQLKETPSVLPNKPPFHPRTRHMQITDEKAREAFSKIPRGSKIVFYQGGLNKAHMDIMLFAKAIEELGSPWVFAAQFPMGQTDFCKSLFKDYKFYYIPYVPAPKHLEVTSNVDYCIATYKHSLLNNEFCAPNKIWECSGFGHPMIVNDVFGLKNTVGRFKAGAVLNFEKMNTEDIKKALLDIDSHYVEMSQNSSALFDSVDYFNILQNSLRKINC